MFKQVPFVANTFDDGVWDFMELCHSENIDARLVGGCVRDALLGRVGNDIDMAVNVNPDTMTAFCKNHNIKSIPTGIAHGTITVYLDNPQSGCKATAIEVTSLRTDVHTNGRHATVQFGSSFEEDAKRRDFTMNALYVDRQRILYDAVGGISDLQEGIVRFIGNPTDRISEDYLRVFRYFRFLGRFSNLDHHLPHLSILPPFTDIKDGLSRLSAERIQKELFQILLSEQSVGVLRLMHQYGILDHLFGPTTYLDNFTSLEYLVQMEQKYSLSICPIRRLVVLVYRAEFDSTRTPSFTELSALKLSRAHIKKADALLRYNTPEEMAMHHLDWWIDATVIYWAKERKEQTPVVKVKLTPPPPFPLTGNDLTSLGYRGKIIGQVINHVKKQWVDRHFMMDRAQCIESATNLIFD